MTGSVTGGLSDRQRAILDVFETMPFSLTFESEEAIALLLREREALADALPAPGMGRVGAHPAQPVMQGLEGALAAEARCFIAVDPCEVEEAVRARLRALGLDDWLDRDPLDVITDDGDDGALVSALCAALGVANASPHRGAPPGRRARPKEDDQARAKRDAERRSNEAWFLGAYIQLHAEMKATGSLRAAMSLGALVEWWRAMRFGRIDPVLTALDAAKRGTAGGQKSAVERREHQRSWETEAQEIAREVTAKYPGKSVAEIAGEVRDRLTADGHGWKPAVSTIEKHIRKDVKSARQKLRN